MTDITDQDLCKALAWAEGSMARGGADAAARYILATVDVPTSTLAEELMDWSHKVFLDEGGKQTMRDYSARAEQIEQERDDARAEVERLTGTVKWQEEIIRRMNDEHAGHAAEVKRLTTKVEEQCEWNRAITNQVASLTNHPATDLPDPADVPYGEAWLVEYHGDCVPALRRLDHPGEWSLVRKNGTGGHVRSQDITLVTRLVPAPRQITTREELDALPRCTVIRDADGITCERARSSEAWYCPLEDCDQTPFIALPATVLWTPEETE